MTFNEKKKRLQFFDYSSQAIMVARTLYLSGQIGIDAQTGEFVEGGVGEQAMQTLKNIGYILQAAGGTHDHSKF